MKKVLLKTALLLCALIVGCGTAWAADETIVFADLHLTNGTQYTAPFDGGDFTVTFAGGGNDGKYYDTGSGIRVYGGGTMTIAATGTKNIAEIVITYDGTNKPTTNDIVNVGTYVNGTGTWTGDAASVTFTRPSGSGHWRVQSIAVTYVGGTPTCSLPTFSPEAGVFSDAQSVSIATDTEEATIYYTVDGTDPTTGSSVYSAAIPVASTTTIKAIAVKDGYNNSAVATAKYFILEHAGTEADPYTVADALDFIESLGTATSASDVYVKGIISQVDEYNETYKSITYWISDDGTTSGQMEVYSGKGVDGADFSAVTDLTVGQTVTVKGKVKKFNDVSEFTSNSQLYLKACDLTKTGDINLSAAALTTTADATAFFTSSSTGAFTFEIADESVATVDEAGVVTPVAQGSTKLTVSQAADAEYKAGEITINVIVAAAQLNETELASDDYDYTEYGTSFKHYYLISETYDGTVAAVSDNEDVATVAITQPTAGEGYFTITPKSVGTAVITLSAPATATCEAADSYDVMIKVLAPVGQTTAAPGTTQLWAETWESTAGTGGNDGEWSGSIASGDVVSDLDGWDLTNSGGAKQCLKVGTGKAKGTATTPAFGQAGEITVSFKAAAWNGGQEQTDLILSVEGDGDLDKTTVSMTKGEFKSFSVTITGATAKTKLTFAGKNASNSRFFLDDVVVEAGSSIKATIPASGFATFCSEYPLDLTTSTLPEGVTAAYRVSGVDDGKAYLAEINSPVMGGVGIILEGTPGTYTLSSVDSEEALGNELVGTLAPTYLGANEAYGLVNGVFQPSTGGVIKAGKAYLPAAVAPVKTLTLVIDTATGVRRVETITDPETIFNLTGVRVNNAQKGIFIVNGKKVVR